MDNGIQGFYKDKVVFLTGATGFLGKGMSRGKEPT